MRQTGRERALRIVAYNVDARLLSIHCANTWIPEGADTAAHFAAILPRLYLLIAELMAQWQDAGTLLPYLCGRCHLCGRPDFVDNYAQHRRTILCKSVLKRTSNTRVTNTAHRLCSFKPWELSRSSSSFWHEYLPQSHDPKRSVVWL